MKPSVSLFEINEVGLVIPWNTGVYYYNQVGGYSCQEEEIEGFYVPITGLPQVLISLTRFFKGEKWKGGCTNGIDEDTILFLEKLFNKYPFFQGLTVDRGQMKLSKEAWIHLDFISAFGLNDFKEGKAILTWPNSE